MTSQVKEPSAEDCTLVGLHSVENMFGVKKQLSLFDDDLSGLDKAFDPLLSGKIGRYGMDINIYECRVLEAILKGFSRTSYRGNMELLSKDVLMRREDQSGLESIYQNVEKIPRLKITQGELLKLADIKKNSTAEITRVLEALTNLNDKHFSFFYRRKLLDEEGREVVGSDGNTVEVDMTGSGPLVTVLEGSHAGSGRHMFYEIVLNPIFLDQRQSYFMLIPDGWRKELERLSGKKKMSAKTHLFLIYLRYSFEKFSRSGEKKEFVIETTQEEIAHRLRFSETTIKRAKKQILERLISCYDIAKRLGYLLDYDVGEVHKLTLNPKKYVSQTLLTSSPC